MQFHNEGGGVACYLTFPTSSQFSKHDPGRQRYWLPDSPYVTGQGSETGTYHSYALTGDFTLTEVSVPVPEPATIAMTFLGLSCHLPDQEPCQAPHMTALELASVAMGVDADLTLPPCFDGA